MTTTYLLTKVDGPKTEGICRNPFPLNIGPRKCSRGGYARLSMRSM